MEALLTEIIGRAIAALGGHDWMYDAVAWAWVRIDMIIGTVPILLGRDSDA